MTKETFNVWIPIFVWGDIIRQIFSQFLSNEYLGSGKIFSLITLSKAVWEISTEGRRIIMEKKINQGQTNQYLPQYMPCLVCSLHNNNNNKNNDNDNLYQGLHSPFTVILASATIAHPSKTNNPPAQNIVWNDDDDGDDDDDDIGGASDDDDDDFPLATPSPCQNNCLKWWWWLQWR